MEQKQRQTRRYPVEKADTLLPFLLGAVRGKSRNNIKSMLARGQVEVDGVGASRHDQPLAPGQVVSVLPEGRVKPPFPILYEDDTLLVIDKPAGLLSVASDREKERTAYRMATEYVRRGKPGARLFVLHRLDRDTSGVLMLAKDEATKRAFQDNWNRVIRRRGYQAVVEGAPPREEDTVRTLLRENAAHGMYSDRSGGREAVTHYRVLRRGKDYTLLDVSIDTGRKNQIRAQLSELGCPVAGDRAYGASASPLGRLCLHACELSFTHPVTGKGYTFRSEPPAAFRRLCATPAPDTGAPAHGTPPAPGSRKRN